jgi:hypothetical protein
MAQAFNRSTLTLAAATAQRLSDLLAAEGYTGSMVGQFLELEDVNSLGDVYVGDSSSVSAANGRVLTIFSRSAPDVVDPGAIWLISATGGDIACTFVPK